MLEAYGLSDPGCLRDNNEDYFISDSAQGIFIVADGMGGANAGEYASKLSSETLYQHLLESAQDNTLKGLEHGFLEANAAVKRASAEHPGLEGMGTTLIAARVVNNLHVQLASVGDSRAYCLSSDGLSILTRDHTWVKEVGSRLGLSTKPFASILCATSSRWPSAFPRRSGSICRSSVSSQGIRFFCVPTVYMELCRKACLRVF